MNKIKYYKHLIENEENKYHLVGNCVNSFDKDTMEYCHGSLNSIEDLAIIDENDVPKSFR